ncbi:hypothetical protein ES703_85343 [subsurface metagenome]
MKQMGKSSESKKQNSTPVLACQVGDSPDVLHSTDVLIGSPFEGGEELAVSGSIRAIGSESSPTPSRGSPVSRENSPGEGSRSFPGVPGRGGGGTAPGYLEPHDKVSADLTSEWQMREDYVKPCPGYWLLGFCDNGHRYAMELYCGREWCPVCGEEWSPAHQRRFARWLPKAYQIRSMGYFVFTIPEDLRWRYKTRKALVGLGHQVQELLKSYGYLRGLRRFHFFGDITMAGLRGYPKFHPHLNCLVDGGYLAPEKLDQIKTAYAGMLGCQVVDIHYRYRRSPGEKVHTLKYVTRATFRDLDWDSDAAMAICGSKSSPGLRNQVSWGRGLWDQEPAWSLDELDGLARKEQVPDLDARAVEFLEKSICPRCGLPITWSKTIEIDVLESVESRPLGGGYRELPWVRPPPAELPAAQRERLYRLELLHRFEVKLARERVDREAKAKAAGYQSWWHAVVYSGQHGS